MPRDIPVGNGRLLVNFDSSYRIRDIYFPHVGQENHTMGRPFRMGVWADGLFSWVGQEWKIDLRYIDDSLATCVTLENHGLAIRCTDVVDIDIDAYVKKVEVMNLEKRPRQVRLFFCHDFHLYGNDIGDTVYYDPRTRCLVHYKANRYFVINTNSTGRWGVAEYTCGTREKGAPKACRDAEDGLLQGEPAAWGSVDSVVAMKLEIEPERSATGYYTISAGTKYHEATNTNFEVIRRGPEEILRRSNCYWGAWLENEPRDFADLPKDVIDIFLRSLLVLKTQIDSGGAIIAANDSDIVRFGRDTYSYMWGRDGAFVAAALARAGYSQVCRRFFQFVARVITDEGFLFQHYNPDGSLASNWHPWLIEGREVLPIQEDSTALVLWALWLQYRYSKDIEFIKGLYEGLIRKSGDFLLSHRDRLTGLPLPSYDLWEERYGVHAFTTSAVVSGLEAAGNFADLFRDESLARRYRSAARKMRQAAKKFLYSADLKRYVRTVSFNEVAPQYDSVMDISILGLATLGGLAPEDEAMGETATALERALTVNTPVGGVARYENDNYQRPPDISTEIPGNPWFISTLWFADYFILGARDSEGLARALPYLGWCARNALPSGILAEQIHPVTGEPLSVSPLTWSHSAFVWTVLEYVDRFHALKEARP